MLRIVRNNDMTIPITPQDANFKRSDCKRFQRTVLKKAEEYLLYFEHFLRTVR